MGVKLFKLTWKFRSYSKILPGNTLSPSSFKESSLFHNLINIWSSSHLTTIQETRIKTIPKKKKCKKAKWLSEEALQIAMNRREVKNKGEKERYTHLNAEFQRIARREDKAFLSDQCKEIEENNRIRKTRDLFKKIRYQGNISCKDGLNKGQKW